jgi:hypothetical protein
MGVERVPWSAPPHVTGRGTYRCRDCSAWQQLAWARTRSTVRRGQAAPALPNRGAGKAPKENSSSFLFLTDDSFLYLANANSVASPVTYHQSFKPPDGAATIGAATTTMASTTATAATEGDGDGALTNEQMNAWFLANPQWMASFFSAYQRSQSGGNPQGIRARANTVSSSLQQQRKALPWPEWDGKQETFRFWLNQMTLKFNVDGPLGFLGDDRATWYSVLQALPQAKRTKIQTFWSSGGPGGTFDPKALFAHLEATFGNVQEKRLAQDQLRGLRQAEGQKFGDFFPYFDEILARAGRHLWDNNSKIM